MRILWLAPMHTKAIVSRQAPGNTSTWHSLRVQAAALMQARFRLAKNGLMDAFRTGLKSGIKLVQKTPISPRHYKQQQAPVARPSVTHR